MGDCPDIKSADCERDNLGDIVKHKHCDVIKAWADGAVIQFWCGAIKRWLDVEGNDPLWETSAEYRVKPETLRYRVSLHKYLDGGYYVNTCGEIHEKEMSSFDSFVRWLTDWQEVGV